MRDPDFHPSDFELGQPLAEFELDDEQSTRALGAALGAALRAGDFLGLVGTLGAGKTTLVQGLTASLAPQVVTTSPTYTLVNLYPTNPPIAHIDLYRLENFDDLESIGYWDVIESGDAIVCVEWFSAIPDSWPEEGVVLMLEPLPSGRRARLWATDSHRDVAQRAIEHFQHRS